MWTILAANPFAHEGFGFNGDVLETNVLNLLVVLGLLVYLGSGFLSSLLESRKETILKSLRDADERYEQAVNQLKQAVAELEDATAKAAEVRLQGEANAKAMAERLAAMSKDDEARLEDAKDVTINLERSKVRAELYEDIVNYALTRGANKIIANMDLEMHKRVMDAYAALLHEGEYEVEQVSQ